MIWPTTFLGWFQWVIGLLMAMMLFLSGGCLGTETRKDVIALVDKFAEVAERHDAAYTVDIYEDGRVSGHYQCGFVGDVLPEVRMHLQGNAGSADDRANKAPDDETSTD